MFNKIVALFRERGMLWEDKINTTYTSGVSLLGNFTTAFCNRESHGANHGMYEHI